MAFPWIKRWMPRSLYGRAALILLLPVVGVQLVVSVAFIQRHYEGVTQQMAHGMALDLALVIAASTAAEPPSAGDLATQLELALLSPAPPIPAESGRVFYDFAAGALEQSLVERLPGLRFVAYERMRRVTVWIDTAQGLIAVSFDRRRVSASNPHQLLVLMVVLGAVMTIIAYLFLRNQLRPIRRLARAAEAFGKGRVIAYQPGGASEVRAAGTAFLDMRQRIERQAQTRSLLLSGVSHDLRTPLTRLRLGLAMIDDPEAAPLLGDVQAMQRMIDSFLDFARDEAADPAVPTDAVALVSALVADAARGGGAVRLAEVEGMAAPVALRPLSVRRAVENLLSNALRHGNSVVVGLAYSDRTLRITVEDDGPGIPPDRRDEALKPFTRLDPARNQNQGGGVGLGLAIAADIARAHGGVLRLGQAAMGGLRADLVLAR